MTKRAFLFPGQGSQYVGMGKELCSEFVVYRQTLEEISDSLHLDMKKLCFEAAEAELTETQNAQPALLAISIGTYRVLEAEAGAQCHYMAGHSLGEYTALTAAGALDLTVAAPLVRQRGLFMSEASPPGKGAMAAVLGLDAAKVEEICRDAGPAEKVGPANYNSPTQTVISGAAPLVDKAMDLARQAGAKRVIKLNVAGPFHTALMQPAADRLAAALAEVTPTAPRVPVIANYDACPNSDSARIIDLLIKQIISPVRWAASMQFLADNRVEQVVEVGPKKVLCGLMRQIDRNIQTLQIEDVSTLKEALKILA